MRLGADRIDTGICAAPARQVLNSLVDVLLHEVERLCPCGFRHRHALRDGVDGNHATCAKQEGASDRELHKSAAIYPVWKMSERNRTCSSVRPCGILMGPTSANGTRRYSACPPA